MKEKIFQAMLIAIGAIATPILIWLGFPVQALLEKLPIHILVRLMVILSLWSILFLAYIVYLKRKHRLIPIHGLLRDPKWNFFCPVCEKLLAYRQDTPEKEHHFHCHKCKQSRYPDDNLTKEQLINMK